jgi:hypothetical protein
VSALVKASCPDCPHFQRRPTSPWVAKQQMIEHNGIYHPERLRRWVDETPMALEAN